MEYKIKVVKMPSKSEYDKRYKIIDENGKTIDDAQGYGFTSVQKAYACYAYKHRDKQSDEKIKEIINWLKEHKEIYNEVENILIYGLKDNCTNTEIREEIKEFLKNENVPYSYKDFMRAWKKVY